MATKFELCAAYKPAGDQPNAIESLSNGLKKNLKDQVLLGVTGSGKTFTVANVIQSAQRPTLILQPNKTLAAQFYNEMKHFFPKNAVEYFVSYYDYYQPEAYVPASDTYIEKDASINEYVEQMRLSATKSLFERKDVIIVATVSAIYGLGDPSAYVEMVLHLKAGQKINQRDILRHLMELQYTRNDLELQRGTYRVRGDVIDVYAAESDKQALRIELFGDEIDKLTTFDPLTHKTISSLETTTIYPKTHYVTPRENVLHAAKTIKVELKSRLEQLNQAKKLVEAQRLEQRTRFDLEMMLELGYCSGIENYSRHLSRRAKGAPPPTLMEYLPNDALLIIDESHVTVPQLGAMYKGDRARKENLVAYGFRLPSALDNRPLKFEEFEILRPQTIFVSATPGTYEYEYTENTVELIVRPTGLLDPKVDIRPVTTQVDDLLSEISKRSVKSERVLITTLTKRMAEDLTAYLAEHQVKVRYLHSDIGTVERVELIRDLRLGVFDVLVGINLLREGLDLPEVSLVAILDADKEGFLRSERSLIQTIGRAARHIDGSVILYADQKTGSIKRAVKETQRRRKIQKAYNQIHGITPKGIKKAIHNLLDATTKVTEGKYKIAEESAGYLQMTPKQLSRHLKKLEREMYHLAEKLEFEKASVIRDQLAHIKAEVFKLSDEV